MAKKGKFWHVRQDYRPLLIKTKRLFPTLLGHVKTKRVLAVGYVCRRSGDVANIRGNRFPWALLCPDYDYVISFWSTRFDKLPYAEKIFVCLHEMLHIPFDGLKQGARSWRKVIKHDIEDFALLRTVYGVNLHSMDDVLKGEKHLMKKHDEVKRFPRLNKIK